ncbi:GDSL-type esterase/lipase family protein [Skermanella mucosa]|uniref:SGNH/GDSL hydrolase family protein n=1 Tax=Skermanella mucosa TaxID=1789672 RepID=UPI00192CC10C|nr:GDSL-type esterase/lipase family protein [Skermanella mucosa]UEM21572.1 GDSL-type esterase/lipase family protein [Skermanella mucosa]
MARQVFPAVLSAIVWIGMMAGSAAGQAPEQCAAPSLMIPASARELPRTSAALSRKKDLRIVAVGSSSTQGTGSSGPAMTYPAQLDRILEARFPGVKIEVVNKGIGGEKAAGTLARLDRDVLALKPDLVIWQLGTNDALGKVDAKLFGIQATEGIRRIREAGADLMLLEPQFLPKQAGNATYAAYVDAVRALGAAHGIPVFRRSEVMKHWLDNKQFTPATMLSSDQLHMTDASYRCLAELMADAIVPATIPAVQPPAGQTIKVLSGPTAVRNAEMPR